MTKEMFVVYTDSRYLPKAGLVTKHSGPDLETDQTIQGVVPALDTAAAYEFYHRNSSVEPKGLECPRAKVGRADVAEEDQTPTQLGKCTIMHAEKGALEICTGALALSKMIQRG